MKFSKTYSSNSTGGVAALRFFVVFAPEHLLFVVLLFEGAVLEEKDVKHISGSTFPNSIIMKLNAGK